MVKATDQMEDAGAVINQSIVGTKRKAVDQMEDTGAILNQDIGGTADKTVDQEVDSGVRAKMDDVFMMEDVRAGINLGIGGAQGKAADHAEGIGVQTKIDDELMMRGRQPTEGADGNIGAVINKGTGGTNGNVTEKIVADAISNKDLGGTMGKAAVQLAGMDVQARKDDALRSKASFQATDNACKQPDPSIGLSLRRRMKALEQECEASFDTIDSRMMTLTREYSSFKASLDNRMGSRAQECIDTFDHIEESISRIEKQQQTGISELQQQILNGPAWLRTVAESIWDDSRNQKRKFTNLYKECQRGIIELMRTKADRPWTFPSA